MKNLGSFITVALLLVILASAGQPQSKMPKEESKGGPTILPKESGRNNEADKIKERRAVALSLLLSLANETRNFGDQTLRARAQARIADALWELDSQFGSSLFRRAWDAAESADKERQRVSGNYVYSPANSREEVLRLAAKRDRLLGEELLRKFREQQERDAKEASKPIRFGPFHIPDETVRQRLNLARHLLDAGDIDRATQFADPVLGIVNIETIDFLSALRAKNPTAADQCYLAMLAGAQSSLQSDADTVSLLSSYTFTPHVYVTSQGRGVFSAQSTQLEAAKPDPQLTVAFFRVAGEILFRQVLLPGQNQDTLLAEGRYPVINHLLILFELYGPKDLAEALRTQLLTLRPLVSDAARQRDDLWRTKWLSQTSTTGDREHSLLDQIERAKTSSERDQLYLKLALMTAEKGDLRARDLADKIENTDLRKAARPFISADLAIRAIGRKDAEQAMVIVRTGDLTHIQTVWVLTEASKLLFKTDRNKALAAVHDAAIEARRIAGSDPDRPRALLAVANLLITTDRAGAWEIISEAVKMANSADGFTGEDGALAVSLISKDVTKMRSLPVQDFDVTGIFTALAKDDYIRAVELARGFEHEAPRVSATIAVVRWLIGTAESTKFTSRAGF